MQEFSVDRFKEAHMNYYKIAERELMSGKKKSHWIWFIFPQLRGLGKSSISDYYGLDGIKEAKCFYNNKYLRRHMKKLVKIISSYSPELFFEAFDELDAKKVKSSMTIFYLATKRKMFKNVIDLFFDGKLDGLTMQKICGIENHIVLQ